MTINHSTITRKEASSVELGDVIETPEGVGVVIDIQTDEVDHYLGFYGVVELTVEFPDGTSESYIHQDEVLVTVASLTLAEVDAIIAVHDTECFYNSPDKCEQCNALWSARADANI